LFLFSAVLTTENRNKSLAGGPGLAGDRAQPQSRAAQGAPFLPGNASPDPEAKAMPQSEVQAWRPHRAGLADPLGLISLQQGRPAVPSGKKSSGSR
jgi:hypothetical protein